MATNNVGKRHSKWSKIYERIAMDEKQVVTGFFEVSKAVKSPEMLQGWLNWFLQRSIPCVVEKRRGRGYALWRKGVEIGSKGHRTLLLKKNIVRSFGV